MSSETVRPINRQQSAGVASCDRAGQYGALVFADQPHVLRDQFVVGLRRRHHPGLAAGHVRVRTGGDLGSMLARSYPSRRVTEAQLGEASKLARGPNLTVCAFSLDDAAMAAIHPAPLGCSR